MDLLGYKYIYWDLQRSSGLQITCIKSYEIFLDLFILTRSWIGTTCIHVVHWNQNDSVTLGLMEDISCNRSCTCSCALGCISPRLALSRGVSENAKAPRPIIIKRGLISLRGVCLQLLLSRITPNDNVGLRLLEFSVRLLSEKMISNFKLLNKWW